MILLKQIQSFSLNIIISVLASIAIVFSFGTLDSWAATSLSEFSSSLQSQIAGMSQVEAVTKNIEGKTQEAIGDVTGDLRNQVMGRAKQVESQTRDLKQAKKQARNSAQEMKDKLKLKEETVAAEKSTEEVQNK
jgi:uncharacterized protein YjbJ (UPF0337 family)